jgi:hypothetical protein
MRFNLRQLLVGVAFVALAAAYVAQSVRYRKLAAKHDAMENRYAEIRDVIKQATHISIVDEENGPNTYVIYLPEGWPTGLNEEFKDIPPDEVGQVLVSRLSSERGFSYRGSRVP